MNEQPHAVLFVDDEPSVLIALKRLFRQEPYEVLTAGSGDEALAILRERNPAVVVSDHRMPSMTGTELLARVRERSPDTIRMILTGYADVKAAVEAINQGAVYRFITKPWNDEELRLAVRRAVEQYALVAENRRLNELTQRQNAELQDLNEHLELKVKDRTRKIRQLNEEIRETFLGLTRTLGGMLEMHSPVVGNHSRRVANLARGTAEAMGLTEEEVFQIETAAALHDVGKLGIPDTILKRPGTDLSRAEQEMIRRHPELGEASVKTIPGLEIAAIIIRNHHEQFDGQGYPDQWKGSDIPVGSRIIAVADAYDKLLNTRGLMATATPEKVLRYLDQNSPSRFDPEIVMIFKRWIGAGDRQTIDAEEVEIGLRDLREGMVLSRDLRTSKGVLLLPQGSSLRQAQIEKIQTYHYTDPIVEAIRIRRSPNDNNANA